MTTTDERPIFQLGFEEALERAGMTEENLFNISEAAYLLGDNDRRKQGFVALWRRWKRGKQNMPLSVETALARPEDIQYLMDKGFLAGRV